MIAHIEKERLNIRLAQVRHRLEQAYLDKLDGKITETFWVAKSAEWSQDQETIHMALAALDQQSPERIQNGVRILELANKAHSLYLSQSPTEKAKLLRMVLSNCEMDAVSVYPTYRKPFDLIFKGVQTEDWLGRKDSKINCYQCQAL